MNGTPLKSKISAFRTQFAELQQEALKNEDDRKELLDISMQAMATLESPLETIWRMIMTPHQSAALMTLIKGGLLPHIVNSNEPKTAQALGKVANMDPLLIVRLMRPLTALGIFKETAPSTYTSTPISQMLIAPPLLGGFQFMYSGATRSLANLPFYLERTGMQNVSGAPGPFQDAHKTDMGMFPWLMSDPPMMTNFNNFMSGQRMNRTDWYDFFPVDEILLKDAQGDSKDSTLLIDIGGGEGHDAEAFRLKFPTAPGQVVVQDLPMIIDNIKPGQIDNSVVQMKHDFFTEQPIKGAKAYYFRSIFHDWPDKDCVQIMREQAKAMKKGHSKLLIFEWILPDMNTPLYPALLDINMMALLNGMERTREQWTTILEAAGLKVVKFWTLGDAIEGLIEAELA